MNISRYLNAAIGQKKITQKALAEMLGTSPAYVNKLCKGTKNPSMELLDRICQALEMTPSEFFSCISDAPTMQLQKAEIRLINNFRGLYDYERDVISDMVCALRRKHLAASHEPQSLPRPADGCAAGFTLLDQADSPCEARNGDPNEPGEPA